MHDPKGLLDTRSASPRAPASISAVGLEGILSEAASASSQKRRTSTKPNAKNMEKSRMNHLPLNSTKSQVTWYNSGGIQKVVGPKQSRRLKSGIHVYHWTDWNQNDVRRRHSLPSGSACLNIRLSKSTTRASSFSCRSGNCPQMFQQGKRLPCVTSTAEIWMNRRYRQCARLKSGKINLFSHLQESSGAPSNSNSQATHYHREDDCEAFQGKGITS